MFQTEGTANAKALRQEQALCAQETAVRVEQSERKGKWIYGF